MQKKTVLNIGVNLFIAIIFVSLNIYAVNNSYEESFTGYAVIYSLIVITINAFLSNNSK